MLIDAPRCTLRFGVKTTPMHLAYDDILRVWEEADELPELDDAWLWDHLMPLAGPPGGAVLEGWTLLAALAARTTRLRLGLLVTSNMLRAPAHLGKIATTVDVISKGRLIMGLGVGGTRQPDGPNPAVAEYAAYGLPLPSPGEGLARLTETITILRRMWTEEVFDHDGLFPTLRGTRNGPGPARPGGPPLLLGGWGDRTLRIIAEHADIWNVPGLAGLRRFAAQHAAAHAKAATVRPNASCHCRARQCTAHGDTKVLCAGSVVLIVQHDPSIGQVWTVSEVCLACSPLVPHAIVVATAVRARPFCRRLAACDHGLCPGPGRVRGGVRFLRRPHLLRIARRSGHPATGSPGRIPAAATAARWRRRPPLTRRPHRTSDGRP
ncbi:LLM class flavin-dependent oxidoreductase [Streptomyces sp. MI02-7b]|uniref:LLM class flavin-dependent oxidoreductase n=1 Tax=Streptomyces sp. MI02-7b TaxID=462941 RepID=UPI0029A2BA27|nr:LLM class flavin-dependent oxidoreductase [Streptomyces sp. MI02-7b]MDX3078395.1 LLM class flavin-dependent oxidoreductase [Streptomyces sp. MI02-7b]